MADLVLGRDVHELMEHRGGHHVSIFCPTHRAAPDRDQDPIRMKNLLSRAHELLVAGGAAEREVEAILEPGRRLLELDRFWHYQSDGLVLFMAPEWSRFYRLAVEIPELVISAGRFHVKPFLSLLASDRRFYVLAVSQNEVRLLEGTRQRIEEVELAEVPHSLREALRYDDLEQRRLFHVAGRAPSGPVVFHGHGIGGEVDKVLVERYLRKVDEGLAEVLHGEHAPLVLAGVGYERAIFRSVTRYPHVLAMGIEGNPDELRPEELHGPALELVEPLFDEAGAQAAERFEELLGRGERSAFELATVVAAALEGRVELVFVPEQAERWGVVSGEEVTVHGSQEAGDEDLLDRAAVETSRHSGQVFVVSEEAVPGPGPVAAVLRY